MLIISILVTAVIIGMLPSLFKLDKVFNITNMILGFVGALVGAFLGFGDAPFLLKYSFLNEITLMIGVSILFVFVKVFIIRSRKLPNDKLV